MNLLEAVSRSKSFPGEAAASGLDSSAVLTRFFDDVGLHLSEKRRHALPWFFLSSGNPIIVEHRRDRRRDGADHFRVVLSAGLRPL